MAKTIEEKLLSAKEIIRNSKKRIKEMERKLYSYQHQADSMRAERQKMRAEAQISEAKLKSADMYISYLAGVACDQNEIRIPFSELAKFKVGHTVECKYNEDKQEVIIRLHEKVTKIPDQVKSME